MNKIIVLSRDELREDISSSIRGIIQEELASFVSKNSPKSTCKKYLTREETAEMLHISLSTLHRFVNNNYLTMKKVGRKSLFALSDVESLIINKNN